MRSQVCAGKFWRKCTSHNKRRNRGSWEKGFSVHRKSALSISLFFFPHHSLLISTSPSFTPILVVFAYFFSCLSFFSYCYYYCFTTANTIVLRIPIIALSPYRSQRSFVLLNPLPIRPSIPVHSLKTASFAQSITQLV